MQRPITADPGYGPEGKTRQRAHGGSGDPRQSSPGLNHQVRVPRLGLSNLGAIGVPGGARLDFLAFVWVFGLSSSRSLT
jgi:hypothetical protein